MHIIFSACESEYEQTAIQINTGSEFNMVWLVLPQLEVPHFQSLLRIVKFNTCNVSSEKNWEIGLGWHEVNKLMQKSYSI